MDKVFQMTSRAIDGGQTQRLTCFTILLGCEVPLKCNSLLKVKCLEILTVVVAFKPGQCIRNGIDARLMLPFRLLQIDEVFAFNSLVIHIVFCDGFHSIVEVTVLERFIHIP